MKNVFVAASLVLATSSYAAEKYTNYLVEPMVCTGEIQEKPEEMGEDYAKVKMTFTSFFSVRKDGTKANSLEVEVAYAGEKGDYKNSTTWYMGPLRQRKGTNEVYRPELSGRGDSLDLEITESKTNGSKRSEKLEGTWAQEGTVVGDYTYDLKCRATVVKKPTKTLDFTEEK